MSTSQKENPAGAGAVAADPRADRAKPLSAARYAQTLAALHHYRDAGVSEVLDAYGVDPAVWAVSDAHWTAELSQCEARGHASLALLFATAYGKERRRIARAGLALKSVSQEPKRKTEPETPETPGGAPAVALPSYMQKETVSAPAVGTAYVHSSHSDAPMPAVLPATTAPSPPAQVQPPAPVQALTPVQPPAQVQPPAPVQPPPPAQGAGRGQLHETSSMNIAELMRAATPFMAGKPASPSPAAPPPAAPPKAPPAAPKGPVPIAEKPPGLAVTADVDVAAMARRVLAFEGAKSPAPPGAAQSPGSPPGPPRPGYAWMAVRFDPETGEPLAQPLWREIPEKPPAK